LWSEPIGPLIFVVRRCARNVEIPILVKQKLRKSQRSWIAEQRKKLKMVGRNDNATPARIKKLKHNNKKKACEVSNPKISFGLYIQDEYDYKGLIVNCLDSCLDGCLKEFEFFVVFHFG